MGRWGWGDDPRTFYAFILRYMLGSILVIQKQLKCALGPNGHVQALRRKFIGVGDIMGVGDSYRVFLFGGGASVAAQRALCFSLFCQRFSSINYADGPYAYLHNLATIYDAADAKRRHAINRQLMTPTPQGSLVVGWVNDTLNDA